MEQSDKARARQQRIRQFSLSVQVRQDNPAMRPMYDAVSRHRLNDKQKRTIHDALKRANAIAAVQRSGGSGLYVDRYLRHFTQEYNGRIFRGEGIHMPNSFNTLNSFLDLDDAAMVLKLLPRQENVIAFGRLLDHITDPEVDTSVVSAVPLIEELTVYEINMMGGHAEFKIPGAEEFVFCGSAFCLEGDEIAFMGVFGRANPNPTSRKEKIRKVDIYPGKEFLGEDGQDMDLSDEPLFGDEGYTPVILLTRVDTKDGKVQSRYILEETRDVFHVLTDNPQDLEWIMQARSVPSDIIETYLSKIDEFVPLFELMFSTPSCLRLMEGDDVSLERHPTQLRLEPQGRDARLASILPVSEAPRFVVVHTLLDLGPELGGRYEIRPSNLKIETAGHWKTLGLGIEGKDKVGHPVQGKTWVTSQNSWYEGGKGNSEPFDRASTIETASEADPLGYVYVLRNASHGRDVYKIGYTTKNPDERALQLGSTSGQPDIFNVVQYWR
ncbi:MAG: GIY-YIG nuclease family protein, partial [Shinella sp.]|nr:GIY-YIG nuclease family protein [Shinella sp.]